MTSGKLRVTIEKAEISIDTELVGKMDPYVVVTQRQISCGEKAMESFKYTTEVHQGAGQHPEWNEEFDIPVTNSYLELTFTIKE